MHHRLDDQELIFALDPSQIFRLTREFGEHCEKGIELGNAVDLDPIQADFSNVLLAGMGGSAAAGDLLSALLDEAGRYPFSVSRNYTIPAWVGSDTLVICASYSGNTEETLSSYDEALEARAHILCVTSGGKLEARAKANKNALLTIPGGQPPRTALGFMLMGPLACMQKLELLEIPEEPEIRRFLDDAAHTWLPESPLKTNKAKHLANELYETTPVIYGLGGWQTAVAKRWKAQINENAKLPAFANAFPELNHNEILGWKGVQDEKIWSLVSLEDGTESAKMRARRRLTFEAFPGIPSHRVQATGLTMLQSMLLLSHLGDYVSLYMSVLAGVDPGDISMLEELKGDLAAVIE